MKKGSRFCIQFKGQRRFRIKPQGGPLGVRNDENNSRRSAAIARN